MGQKQKIQAETNAANSIGQHDESPHGGGRRPPRTMWPASIFSICLCLYFLLWPDIVFSALAPYCIVFLGRLGPKTYIFSASNWSGSPALGTGLSQACHHLRAVQACLKVPAGSRVLVTRIGSGVMGNKNIVSRGQENNVAGTGK